MSNQMQGRRVYPDESGRLHLAEGDYGRSEKAGWMVWPPGYHSAGSIAAHEVTEHENGTITVSPSIQITDGHETWHGYLEAGMWRQV